VIRRGEIFWVDLGRPARSRPAKRRPVLVVQSDGYNASRLATVLTAVISSNSDLAALPGNVFLPSLATGLPPDAVVNVTALVTADKRDLDGPVGTVPTYLMQVVDHGLTRVLGLCSPFSL
jgi:mRNA interferase MazF